MVRRPSAVLTRSGSATLAFAGPLAAFAYFLAAPTLPALPAGDATVLVAGSIGLLLVAASTLAVLPAYEMLIAPLLVGLGAGLLVAALNGDGTTGVGAGANVFEAVLAGAAGVLFARWLAAPAIAVAVAFFVSAVDVLSVAFGPTSRLLEGGTARVDALSFDLPAWGDAGSAGHLGASDAFFVSLFAAWAWRFGLRGGATIAGLVLGLLGALVLSVVLDRAIPALPFVAAGFLLPNAGRLWTLLAGRGDDV